MSSRSRAAANLAWHLTDEVGIDVRVSWDKPPGRPGAWLVEWTDGPTVATMRGHAENLVRYCRPLAIAMLRFSRYYTHRAWAAAMLTLAHRGELPERPAVALGLAEGELINTDTADWAHLWTHADQLVRRTDCDLYQVVALIHATVTKAGLKPPPDAQPGACQHCAAPLPAATAGRPARYCGTACRQAARRARNTVTKPRDETTCATCGRPITPSGTGRPARHCSAACRTRAWRRAKGMSR